MKANCWYGKHDVRIENVPDPHIINQQDVVVRITSTAICGSDLHLYGGFVPGMQKGDILGHEFMGEVVEVGKEVKKLKLGDRVVVPFPISCGKCFFCEKDNFSLCENSNPNSDLAEQMWGHSTAAIFGYSHVAGGYAGGQAEYARVPFADIGPIKIENGLDDEQVLFLSDILPTGYMAAENCNIQPGDVVAVWGCGPIGLFAIQSAYVLGASKVIGIDRFETRLEMARKIGALGLNYEEVDIQEVLRDLTGGRGPDSCIDAVGMEAHGQGLVGFYDRAKQAVMAESDRPIALRSAMMAVRNGGTLSVPGVYGGLVDKIPFGAVMNRAVTIKTGQTHVQRYMRPLLEKIERGEVDTTFLITHRMKLEDAPKGYEIFQKKQDGCVKIVLKPEWH